MNQRLVPRGPSGKNVSLGTSVQIDPERWRHAWYIRRMTMTAVSGLVGKSTSWACMMAHRGRCSYYVLDQLATELGEPTADLLYEVASDQERDRIKADPYMKEPS